MYEWARQHDPKGILSNILIRRCSSFNIKYKKAIVMYNKAI